ncbi:PqqD family protein [Cyanobium sp. FGCU-6]|nr:PqqD family protein [Cyanobium sp. FGCU6]
MDDRTLITRRPDAMATDIDDATVILSLPSNCYVSLDAVGQRIWALLEQPLCLQALVERLQDQFEGDANAIRRDVEHFLRELESDGLLTLQAPEPAA